MFEKLTAGEAAELMRKLTSGYESSKTLARETSGWALATTDAELRRSYAKDLLAQGGIRAENTSLRWQLRREALGGGQP